MLLSLHVKNLALIEETEVLFTEGLNILTGETGAGKSVIIGSINLALGAKADKELIRTGAESALVELIFALEGESQLEAVRRMELCPEEDGTLLIQRKILPTRNVCKVGGETVTVRQLRELAELLIDIHGQNEHQSLLHRRKHREILDEYAGERLIPLKERLRVSCREYGRLTDEWENADADEAARIKEAALAEFELKEIEEAAPAPGEDEQLEARYRKMVNSKRIGEALSAAHVMTGYEEDSGAGGVIGRALRELKGVADYDGELADLMTQLQDIDNLLNDFNRALSVYREDMEFDAEGYARAEERLNLLNHLKAKYGRSIEEILSYRDERRQKLERLSNFDAYRDGLRQRMEEGRKEIMRLCGKISGIRSKEAAALSKQMKQALYDLNFLDVEFEIQVRPDEQAFNGEGYDEVEFMISTNPGESLRPLNQIASGGELSRIMLAIKAVLADRDDIHTLVFDEIDAGISGRTAWKVSGKLGVLGKAHQVICITHLPQIAAMADTHFLIEKKVEKQNGQERTVTLIRCITQEESIEELARLLGGETITDAVLNNAKEMKELATNTKQY